MGILCPEVPLAPEPPECCGKEAHDRWLAYKAQWERHMKTNRVLDVIFAVGFVICVPIGMAMDAWLWSH